MVLQSAREGEWGAHGELYHRIASQTEDVRSPESLLVDRCCNIHRNTLTSRVLRALGFIGVGASVGKLILFKCDAMMFMHSRSHTVLLDADQLEVPTGLSTSTSSMLFYPSCRASSSYIRQEPMQLDAR